MIRKLDYEAKNDSFHKRKEKGKLVITGRKWYKGAPFEFSLREQSSGNYLVRGFVKAMDSNGEVLKKRGKALKQVLENSKDGKTSKRLQKLNIQSEVHCNTLEEEVILSKITEVIERLYRDNTGRIMDSIESGYTPETIVPSVAADFYAMRFVYREHANSSPEYQKTLIKRIKNVCVKLPNKAMASFSAKRMSGIIKQAHFGEDSIRELSKFWTFCIEDGICDGSNPVVIPAKKKTSPRSLQLQAMRMEELETKQIDLITKALIENPGGANTGIALMLSGFKPKYIEGLKWNQVVFKKEDDFVIVEMYLPERAGATHVFSRPVLPQTALVLRKQFKAVSRMYTPTEVAEMPVVSMTQKLKQKMDAAQIVQEATRMLRSVAVSNFVLAALREEDRTIAAATKIFGRTYEKLLSERCNLINDIGTLDFLLGKPLAPNTTNDAYTCFTSDSGMRRLYSILHSLRDNEQYKDLTVEDIKDGMKVTTVKPKQSRDYAKLKMTITLLPGEEIKVMCEHGVDGEYHVMESVKVVRTT